jgi:hypothetical protein
MGQAAGPAYRRRLRREQADNSHGRSGSYLDAQLSHSDLVLSPRLRVRLSKDRNSSRPDLLACALFPNNHVVNMSALLTYTVAYGFMALVALGYYLLVAFCDRSQNADGTFGIWPLKKRWTKKYSNPAP